MLGCAGGAPRTTSTPAGPISFRADWNDLDAAAEVASSEIEATVLRTSEPEAGLRVFDLRTVSDAPGVLEVRWLDGAPGLTPGENALVEARCAVGRLGDPRREARLLGALKRRLTQLRGRDAAPLD